MNRLFFIMIFGLVGMGIIVISAGAGEKGAKAGPGSQASKIDWEIPMAAGVWYPGSGSLPDKPMRYYRVRCFPGCHVGSKYGAFPDTPLKGDRPIFPTSTINNIEESKAEKKHQK